MLNHLLIAVGGIVGLMLAWLAVQGLKRRSDPHHAGQDVLACHTCGVHTCTGCALHDLSHPEPGHHGGMS